MLIIYVVPDRRVTYKGPGGKKVIKKLSSNDFKTYLSGNTASYWVNYTSPHERQKLDQIYNLDDLISQAPHLVTGLYYGSKGESDLFYLINEDFRTIDESLVRNVNSTVDEFGLDLLIVEFLRQNIGKKVVCIYH